MRLITRQGHQLPYKGGVTAKIPSHDGYEGRRGSGSRWCAKSVKVAFGQRVRWFCLKISVNIICIGYVVQDNSRGSQYVNYV